MINAIMVTHSELSINGQNPNLSSVGDQSAEKIKVVKEWWLVKRSDDFSTNPVPIASGKSRKKLKHTSIHLDEMLSISIRFVILFEFVVLVLKRKGYFFEPGF